MRCTIGGSGGGGSNIFGSNNGSSSRDADRACVAPYARARIPLRCASASSTSRSVSLRAVSARALWCGRSSLGSSCVVGSCIGTCVGSCVRHVRRRVHWRMAAGAAAHPAAAAQRCIQRRPRAAAQRHPVRLHSVCYSYRLVRCVLHAGMQRLRRSPYHIAHGRRTAACIWRSRAQKNKFPRRRPDSSPVMHSRSSQSSFQTAVCHTDTVWRVTGRL